MSGPEVGEAVAVEVGGEARGLGAPAAAVVMIASRGQGCTSMATDLW